MADDIRKRDPSSMTTASRADQITLSYVRQPVEQAEVIVEAAGRFGTPLQQSGNLAARYLFIGIAGGAGLSLFLHAYRGLILLPVLGLTPLIKVSDLLAICILPCFLTYLLLMAQARREARQRLVATAAAIRPDVTVAITITAQGIEWNSPGTSCRLAWTEITDITPRFGRIEFDSDASVAYIPAHAFHNQQEQAAILARIQAFWRPGKTAKP
jgi:hypothetical protein